ncbi:MAG: glycosyl hydrolase [Candidatus Margulisiibacteriota bacterium]
MFLLVLVVGCGTTTSTTTTTTTSTTSTTIAGAYIGAFVNGLSNTPAFESAINRNLAVNMWYINWSTSFPTTDCNTASSYGAVPMLTWEPSLATTNTLKAIASGNYDAYITTFAQAAKAWGSLVYIRFGHEMNGNWYPWDGTHNGGSTGPAKYIAAWRHIHGIFSAEAATNVRWVWSPNHVSQPNEAWNEAIDYYPGDAYVDWIAFDGYNWSGGDWKTFDQLFSTIYATFESYGKPLMIGEFASATDEAQSKATWITNTFASLENDYPKIKIFNWFNTRKYEATAGRTIDWRIESTTADQTAFKNAVSDSYFLESKPSN